jgi:putative spermidine/putrescine transport system permease protein
MGISASNQTNKKPFSNFLERLQKNNFGTYIIVLAPATIFFLFIFLIPILALLYISFNPSLKGAIVFQDIFTLENYVRFFSRPIYTNSLLNSIKLGVITSLVSLVMSYPLAYLIAKTKHPTWNNILMILILVPLQIDQMVRAYGLMTILGDNGVINATLLEQGVISKSLPLMYNFMGVVIGLTQITIPFMVLSLIGIIRRIDPFFEEAAQNLGANRFKTFIHIILPLSMPGIFAGTLLVFAISISNFVIPVMLGGSNYFVISMWIYKIINETNNWQFAATVSSILLIISVIVVYLYNRVLDRYYGGIMK